MPRLEKVIAHALVAIAIGLSIPSSAVGQKRTEEAAFGRARSVMPQAPATASCAPSWRPTFGPSPGPDGMVDCLAVFDDGSGPALYAGGVFQNAGAATASYVAKWNGASWASLGNEFDGEVLALTVFDDGTGPALFAAGVFTTPGSCVAKWNGAAWSPLGSGMLAQGSPASVIALAVFDDGSGPALYAGGIFASAGGVTASSIAKWNGATWSAVGPGVTGSVAALTVFDDGTGPALFAGGGFTAATGMGLANSIAKWDGTRWSALGSGLGGPFFWLNTLTVFDDGSGPALFVGGSFATAGGAAASGIAKWNGTSWAALGSGITTGPPPYGDQVLALAGFDDGSGPALFVGGKFTVAGGVVVNHIAKWNGSGWTALGSGMDSWVRALGVFDDGSGPALYAAGAFSTAGGVPASHTAKWNGAGWSPFARGLTSAVSALAVFDDGTGPALYAGGAFLGAGGVTAHDIAKWSSAGWAPLGSGVSSTLISARVNALAVFDDGSGPALYAGGRFATAGAVSANNIARWNGSSWSAVGGGVNGLFGVFALTVFDDGSGPALIAGGDFGVAKWNGVSWTPLGNGLNAVRAFTVFDDGGGPALYAAGSLATAPITVARWDGIGWTPVGAAFSGANADLSALEVFNDGSGPALYAAGAFTTAGGVLAPGVARWNGTTWAPLGLGISGWVGKVGSVFALEVFDDGSGPALYAGGYFPAAAGNPAASDIAKWDGASWSPLGSGIAANHPFYLPTTWTDAEVLALAVFDDGGGPALYVGGSFAASPAGDSYLARWGCTLPAGARTFGASSPGCAGALALGVTSPPQVGNAAFAITCTNAPPSAPGALLAGTALAPPVPIQGVQIWVLPIFAPIVGSDPRGHAAVPLPIPPSPVFVGAQFDVQLVWLGPNTPPPCPPRAWSASNALELTIQP